MARPVRGANVFLLETLDGDLTGEDGRFAFDTRAAGTMTLMTLPDGYRESRSSILVPVGDTLIVQLVSLPVALDPIHVQAGRLAAGSEAGVELNSLQVVTTPGSAADVYRALQTFSGLQTVDEGAGLFVRAALFSKRRSTSTTRSCSRRIAMNRQPAASSARSIRSCWMAFSSAGPRTCDTSCAKPHVASYRQQQPLNGKQQPLRGRSTRGARRGPG
jgi:hypothetical protein